MANVINANGIQIDTLEEILSDYTTSMQQIYGADINVESNSPDGQWLNILAQITRDLSEFGVAIYNSFDPDFAQGVVLDERVAINNIQRRGASYTFQNIQITVDRALNLAGLDANANNPDGVGFTVGDNANNQFILLDSQTIASAGTYTFSFRAKLLGAIETLPNTIVNQITVVLGVTAVNNSTGASSVGQNEETDFELRERRKASIALGATGYLNGLQGAILNLDGVVDAEVYENDTNITNADGIPPHSIWVIVEGGSNTDIANQIYSRKSAGCGMRGSIVVNIPEPSGHVFEARFDRPIAQNLYIQFSIQALRTGQTFDAPSIKQYMVDNLSFGIGKPAIAENIAEIANDAIIATAGEGSGAVINLQISLTSGSGFTYFLNTTTLQHKFSTNVANITIL